MDRFINFTATAAPLRHSNVDTDQIIPAVYLKRITRKGYEDALFAAWRSDPQFVLNDPRFAGAQILVAGPDFGTGSSREHAVWALQDYGFRVVIASRFADIFRGNSGKAGLLTAVVSQDAVERIWDAVEAAPDLPITVHLGERTISFGDAVIEFDIDDYVRWRLMEGLDDIAITEQNEGLIADFERARPAFKPRTA